MTQTCACPPGKTPHASRGDAQRVANEMNARARGRQLTVVYRCPVTGAWHVTHKGRLVRRLRRTR